jgi:hypothetical protein
MTKFKIGDNLKAVNWTALVTLGNIYPAKAIRHDMICIENNAGIIDTYPDDFFELVEPVVHITVNINISASNNMANELAESIQAHIIEWKNKKNT